MSYYLIVGYCPIYNAEKKEILENYALGYECLKFSGTEQCPSRYPSSEAYNCYVFKSLLVLQNIEDHRNCSISVQYICKLQSNFEIYLHISL